MDTWQPKIGDVVAVRFTILDDGFLGPGEHPVTGDYWWPIERTKRGTIRYMTEERMAPWLSSAEVAAARRLREAARFCVEHGQVTNNGDKILDALAAWDVAEEKR